MSISTIFFGGLAILSLFVFFNVGKVKASSKQMNRDDRINRFGKRQKHAQARPTIIEGEAEEIKEDKDNT